MFLFVVISIANVEGKRELGRVLIRQIMRENATGGIIIPARAGFKN